MNTLLKKFKSLNTDRKIIIILLIVGLVIISYLGISKAWYKYKYFKTLEKEVIELRETIKAHDEAETKLLTDAEADTKKVQKKSKSIDEKLKQDEKTIDNSDVTDRELDEFLSRYEKRKN